MKKLILLITMLAACTLLTFAACAVETYEKDTYEEDRRAGAIVINPNDLWQVVVAVGAGIVTLAGAGGVITGVIRRAKAPNEKQNERISALEDKVKKIDDRLDLGDRRFESDADRMRDLEKTMKDTNRVIVESLQALTEHAIDGNNIENLRASKEALNDYLRSKL